MDRLRLFNDMPRSDTRPAPNLESTQQRLQDGVFNGPTIKVLMPASAGGGYTTIKESLTDAQKTTVRAAVRAALGPTFTAAQAILKA